MAFHFSIWENIITVLETLKDNFFFNCSAPKNYHLAMHTFGVFTTATSLKDLTDMVQSAAVVFGSPCSGENVEKHFHNLQLLMQKANVDVDGNDRNSKADEDLKVN